MPDERFKGFLGFFRQWFFWRREYPLFASDGQEGVLHARAPNPDELALGWAEGEDGETDKPLVQLKGVPQDYRQTHFYVVGASGSGKSKFLETLAKQDITNGDGFGVIDPHADLTEDLKGYLYLLKKDEGEFLRERVILIDPTDPLRTVCFNPLERLENISPAGIASGLVEAFKKIWGSGIMARGEDVLKNSLIALIENDLTLAELPLFLTDAELRHKVMKKVKHPICRQYFARFDTLAPHTRNEWIESTLNKVNAFLSDDNIRQMFVSPKSTFNLREVMDSKKILLVKLDKGHLAGNADLLGSLLLARIQMAAFGRTDTFRSKRVPFYLYIDEFQDFATDSFLQILAQSRKYKLPLILAHQNLAQLTPNLRASILTNCWLQAYFRVSRDDASVLAKESMASIFNNPPGWEWYIQQLQELQPTWCVVKNRVEGGVIKIKTLDLPPPHEEAEMSEEDFAEEVAAANIGGSYLRLRESVDEEYEVRKGELFKLDEPESFRQRNGQGLPASKDKPVKYVPAEE